ncbi:MAG: aspartate carbamoyltransferase regulatory subunit [Promethearchaeota archaeon]
MENKLVIDEIPQGLAYEVLRVLGIREAVDPVNIFLNIPSERLGMKDKIELINIEADQRFFARLSLVASTIVVREIEDGKETEHKLSFQIPQVVGMLICDNPNCVTNVEIVTRRFDVEQVGVVMKLRCVYCEKVQESLIFEE